MYYGILATSTCLFGLQFFCDGGYRRESGSGVGPALLLSVISSLAGALFLLCTNSFSLSVTVFTLLIAGIAAINGVVYTFCTLKALDKINLSLYAMFSMLGGMVLPSLSGILFFEEPLTAAKIICLVLITLALCLTVKGVRGQSGGLIYYAGVFALNGLAGVLSKIFQEAPYKKADAASYSIWISLITAVLGVVLLCFFYKKVSRPTWKAVCYASGKGLLNRTANYLLLLALAVLPASVQYPFVTGGVMIVSTLISVCIGEKVTKKELLAVGIAFLGILALTVIPF